MRARLVIPAAVVVASVCVLMGQGRAWAGDPDGQYSWGGATASGGQLTVQAGGIYWTPPAGSSWAKQAESDPSPGKPDPNQPYGCTYKDGGASATEAIGSCSLVPVNRSANVATPAARSRGPISTRIGTPFLIHTHDF